MDIARVRSFFQDSWDIDIITDNTVDLDSAIYSLQQPTLNSDDHFLHVTTNVDPELTGAVLRIDGQYFIVHKAMLERSNNSLIVYRLIVAYDNIILHKLIKYSNALGTYPDEATEHILCNCALAEYGKKERLTPTAQPLDSYEQEFYVGTKQLIDYRAAYTLDYQGIRYKVTSFELDSGVVKVRATENL
jgi:hypothetical protein